MTPITIDLSGLQAQFNLDGETLNELTEVCVNAVTVSVFSNWEALAKQKLKATASEYIQSLIKVDKGRLNKQIVLIGVLPNMLEQGASAFDIKEGFKKSSKVHYTIPVYNKKGTQIKRGGDWYLTIPFRMGVPGVLGQAGFSGQIPQEVYDIMLKKNNDVILHASEIPSPWNIPTSRAAIEQSKTNPYYAQYEHKNSIYEGLMKQTAQYSKTSQNTYKSFRRAGANSDPLSWIHKGLIAQRFSEEAVKNTDVETIVENEVTIFLKEVL